MPLPVIPVLSVNHDQLTRPVDQIAYILRHAYYNPGWTSSYIETYLISMQKLFAECSHDLRSMAGRFEEKLSYALREMFGDVYKVSTEIYDIDPLTKGVKVAITDRSGQLVLSSDDLRMSNGNLYLRDYNKEN